MSFIQGSKNVSNVRGIFNEVTKENKLLITYGNRLFKFCLINFFSPRATINFSFPARVHRVINYERTVSACARGEMHTRSKTKISVLPKQWDARCSTLTQLIGRAQANVRIIYKRPCVRHRRINLKSAARLHACDSRILLSATS